MTFRLTPLQGELLDGTGILQPGDNTIGRSRSCSVRIAAPDVSGKHCLLKVSGQAVAIENLSPNGTRVDGNPIEFISLLTPGQVLHLGTATRLRLDDDGPSREEATAPASEPPTAVPTSRTSAPVPASPPEPETAKGPSLPPPTCRLPSPPPPPPPPPPDDPDAIEQTRDAYEHTRAMATRVLRPEDIEALREAERAKPRKRMALLIATGILLVVAVFLLWPESKPPETLFEWPVDKNGVYLTAVIPAPRGGYEIGIPAPPNWSSETPDANTIRATTWLSRDANIPMVIELLDLPDPRFLHMGLPEAIADWQDRMRARGTGWYFDPPSSLNFFGRENGIPFRMVSYTHQENGSWFGVARLCLYQDRLLSVRTEVPYSERVRASAIINYKLLEAEPAFERAFWAGSTVEPPADAAPLLARARTDLQRNAPSLWAGLEQSLFEACRRAAINRDALLLAESQEMLVRLREKQRLWFNAQKIARSEALLALQEARVRQIADLCKGVFSNPGDQRHSTVRRDDW